jgi:hypothetical protein
MSSFIDCMYCGRPIFWSTRSNRAYELVTETLNEERAGEDVAEAPPKPQLHACPRRPAPAPVRARQATPDELKRIREGRWRPGRPAE